MLPSFLYGIMYGIMTQHVEKMSLHQGNDEKYKYRLNQVRRMYSSLRMTCQFCCKKGKSETARKLNIVAQHGIAVQNKLI